MTHAATLPLRSQIDLNRIAGETGAIAVNAALLLALLAPIVPPAGFELPGPETTVIVVEPAKPKRVEPPPVPVQREQPRKAPTTPAIALPQPVPIESPAVVIDGAGEPFIPPMEQVAEAREGTGGDSLAPTEPVTGAHLRYASAPPPAYPRDALRDGATGTVLLEVLVDIDGRPLDVRIARSSGRRDLDQAARRQVLKRWRFVPAMENGEAVQALGMVPVEFSLVR